MNDKKLLLIVGEAGTGKTTILAKIAKKINNDIFVYRWLFYVELAKCHHAIQRHLAHKNIASQNFIDFLEDANTLGINKELEKLLIKHNKNIPMCIIFAGFDKMINNTDKKAIIGLMKFLQEKSAFLITIVVTTCNNALSFLQQELNVFVHSIMPLTCQEKAQYLEEFKKIKNLGNKTNSSLRPIASTPKKPKTELSNSSVLLSTGETETAVLTTSHDISSGSDGSTRYSIPNFVGNVLMLRLYAEYINIYSQIPTFKALDSELALIENLIDQKYKFWSERNKISLLRQDDMEFLINNRYKKPHQVLAFLEIFPDHSKLLNEMTLSNDKTLKESFELSIENESIKVHSQVIDSLSEIGFIKKSSNKLGCKYKNHIFASYFAAQLIEKWLLDQSNSCEIMLFLLKIALIPDQNQMVKRYIDTKIDPCLLSINNISIENAGEVLLAAADDNNKNIFDTILNKNVDASEYYNVFTYKNKKYNEETILSIVQYGSNGIVKLLLGALLKDNIEIDKILKLQDRSKKTLLHLLIQKTVFHKELQSILTKITPNQLLLLCKTQDEDGKTILHTCCEVMIHDTSYDDQKDHNILNPNTSLELSDNTDANYSVKYDYQNLSVILEKLDKLESIQEENRKNLREILQATDHRNLMVTDIIVERGNVEMTKTILDILINKRIKLSELLNHSQATVLHVILQAVHNKKLDQQKANEIAHLILNKYAQHQDLIQLLKTTNAAWGTLLHAAAYYGNVEMTKTILDILINKRIKLSELLNHSQATVLHVILQAVHNKKLDQQKANEIAHLILNKYLIKNGKDCLTLLAAKNNDGIIALAFAAGHNPKDVQETIKKRESSIAAYQCKGNKDCMPILGLPEAFSSYYQDQVAFLLQLRLEDAAPAVLKSVNVLEENYTLRESNEDYIAAKLSSFILASGKDTILIPLNIGGSHLVGIAAVKDGKNVVIHYMDSELNPPPESLFMQISAILKSNDYSMELRRALVGKQKYSNCGPEVIENFICYFTGKRATQENAVPIHSLLLENLMLDQAIYANQIEQNKDIIKYLSHQIVSDRTEDIVDSSNEAAVSLAILPQIEHAAFVAIEGSVEPHVFLTSHAMDKSASAVVYDVYWNPAANLFNKLDISWHIKKIIYHADVSRFNQILKYYNIDSSIDIFKDNSKFKKELLLKLHPDKGGSSEDFVFVSDLKEKFEADVDVYAVAQGFLYNAMTGFKILDLAVGSARFMYAPTQDNMKKVLMDSAQIYGLYSGVSFYPTAISALDAAHYFHLGEYKKAAEHIMITACYAVVPYIIAQLGIPYIGLVYGTAITVYSGYNAVSNAYSLYLQVNSRGSSDQPVNTDDKLSTLPDVDDFFIDADYDFPA